MAISTQPTGDSLKLTRVTLRPILADEENEWNRLMEDVHPLGNAQFAGHRIKYVAEHGERAVALLCVSASAYHLADRDRWIGWSEEQAMQRRHLVVQNSRLLILAADGRQNLSSRVLGQCAKRVVADWRERFGFSPLLMETFVDPVHFRGTCYRAAGWTEVGSTRGFRRDGREFYAPDSHPKQIWLKPLHADAAAVLRAAVLPEPWARFEKPLPGKRVAARLGFEGLRSLFMVLQSVPDPRGSQGRRYPVGCCLSIVICAMLAGCKSIRECAEFGATLGQKQLEALRAPVDRKTGRREAPCHTTLWRVTSAIEAEEFERRLRDWLAASGQSVDALALDGKSLRATLDNEDGGGYVVSAVPHAAAAPLFSTRSSPAAKARKWPLPSN